jgi:hypothetical protein
MEGVVKNIGLVDVNINITAPPFTTLSTAGGLVVSNRGLVENSFVTGTINGGGSDGSGVEMIGSLVGNNTADGIVRNSYSAATVTGLSEVGGLVGINSGEITNCYTTGNVSGTSFVGGIVGRNSNGTVTNSYATGNVSGGWGIGGVVGEHDDGTIQNCVALNSSIERTFGTETSFGRVVGGLSSGALVNNFARGDMPVNGSTITGGQSNTIQGTNVNPASPNGGYNNQPFWEEYMYWNFNTIWEWDTATNLPRLR